MLCDKQFGRNSMREKSNAYSRRYNSLYLAVRSDLKERSESTILERRSNSEIELDYRTIEMGDQ